ncbi:HNH endonuclease family protein [Streptosporangium canum]|uniref:HNH endonuclease family protein n=1 Tax=Streptosporangium canum TaxID=324952 RepID=UPI0036A939AA
MPICTWRTAAALSLPLALALTGSASATPAPHTASLAAPAQLAPAGLPTPITAALARTALADLTVAEPRPMTGYSRDKFPHWASQSGQGNGCDTREVVLSRDGQDVQRDDQCRAASGSWYSEYDGRTITSAGGIDIDHMVPLANAWRSGADAWTTPQRRAFANDLQGPQLIAVSAASNRSKGDQNPAQWAPPLASYHCVYARAWVEVKRNYGLTVTAPEKARLVEMLDTCPAVGTRRGR